MRRAVRWAAQVLSPRGSISVGSKFQMSGFYLAGFLCLVLAALKLTIEGDWSWWRVLLPLWVVLGHNALYIVVGFVWLSFADDGEAATIPESNSSYAYQVAALVCFLIFADNLLGRIEGTADITWMGLRSGLCVLIVAALSLIHI